MRVKNLFPSSELSLLLLAGHPLSPCSLVPGPPGAPGPWCFSLVFLSGIPLLLSLTPPSPVGLPFFRSPPLGPSRSPLPLSVSPPLASLPSPCQPSLCLSVCPLVCRLSLPITASGVASACTSKKDLVLRKFQKWSTAQPAQWRPSQDLRRSAPTELSMVVLKTVSV